MRQVYRRPRGSATEQEQITAILRSEPEAFQEFADDEQTLDRIFREFATADESQRAFARSVRGFLENLERISLEKTETGTIAVATRAGVGTRFTLRMPLREGAS
jgi:signal transduction histidine kinase